jgi:hypothetical protein
MTGLRDSLRSALASRYEIERELDASRYAAIPRCTVYDVAPTRFLFTKQPPYPGAQVAVDWLPEATPHLETRR